MSKAAGLKISKLDAARRQLETAVRLYFASADPVSIHNLTAAAYQLLEDLAGKVGGPTGIKDRFLALFGPDEQPLVRRKLNEAQNFFKHADEDHDQVLDFRPESTEYFLADSCYRYSSLAGEQVPLFGLFITWFTINGVGKDTIVPPEAEPARAKAVRMWGGLDRQKFLTAVLPAAELGNLNDL